MKQTGIVILAAGESLRLGQPKQLLSFQNSLLVQRIVDEAIKAKPCSVIVVTGANAEAVSVTLPHKEVTFVYNENWREGMASGIVAGVKKLMEMEKAAMDVILAVCDQPFVTEKLFIEIVNRKKETGKGIIACTYADTMGTPVLFDRMYFQELQDLKGLEGAKGLVKKLKTDVATVSFPDGNIDIDTAEDYKNLLSKFETI